MIKIAEIPNRSTSVLPFYFNILEMLIVIEMTCPRCSVQFLPFSKIIKTQTKGLTENLQGEAYKTFPFSQK